MFYLLAVVYLVDGVIDSIQQQQVPESLIQLLLPSHRRSNLKSECLSCMYNWHLDIDLFKNNNYDNNNNNNNNNDDDDTDDSK